MSTKPNEHAQSTVLILFLIGASVITYILNSFATADFLIWYMETHKSPFAPDPVMFKIIGSTLVWLYAVAGWILWCKDKFKIDTRECKLFFLVLLLTMLTVMSTAGVRAIEVTLVLLVLLWFISLIAMRVFAHTDKIASFVVLLMLLWTTFEMYLYLTALL